MAMTSKCTILLFLATILATAHGMSKKRCLNQPTLVCRFRPINRSGVRGTAKLSPKWIGNRWTGRCATLIEASVRGMTKPKQGWHIHEFGDVTSKDGSATGPHYTNPKGRATKPGLPGDRNRHWGDIGNLIRVRPNKGKGKYYEIDTTIRRTSAVLGRSIIIHLNEDLGRVPGNNPGPRISQCVLGLANTSK